MYAGYLKNEYLLNVAFELISKPLNEWEKTALGKQYDWKLLNPKSVWDHGSDWMISSKWSISHRSLKVISSWFRDVDKHICWIMDMHNFPSFEPLPDKPRLYIGVYARPIKNLSSLGWG